MPTRSHIHVIDPDFRRRARISHELMRRDFHAEIYEDLEEFGSRIPDEGTVLAIDDPARCDARGLMELLEGTGRRLPVAMYSDEPSPEKIVNAMLEGALDYLQFPFEPKLLDTAVARLSSEGERRAEQDRRRAHAKAAVEELSARELEVLASMVQGNSNKEIAQELGISPRTVEYHLHKVFRKLDVTTRKELRTALADGGA